MIGPPKKNTAAPTIIDGNVRQIDERTCNSIAIREFSSNNSSVRVEGLGVFFSDNKTLNTWYHNVTDYVKGSIDIAYKIGSRYFVVEFEIYGPGRYRVGDSKGSNSINMVKIGVFNEIAISFVCVLSRSHKKN